MRYLSRERAARYGYNLSDKQIAAAQEVLNANPRGGSEEDHYAWADRFAKTLNGDPAADTPKRSMAGQVWDGYKNNLLVQDIVETAIATLGIAGAQALFSDMSMEEIAAAAAVGVGAGMAGRPVGDRLGRMAGRYADKAFPQTSARFKQNVDESIETAKQMGGNMGAEVMDAKLQHHLPEGRGIFEGMGSIYGRAYGDNLAQAAVGLAAPVFLGSEEEVPVAA